MKKVLVMVMSHDQFPYKELRQTSIDTWESLDVPGVETVFYMGGDVLIYNDKILTTNVPDTFHNMGRKTLEAFQWAIDNREFDYICRPNASTYVNKKILSEHIQTLPDRIVKGLVVNQESQGQYFPMIWGPCYILSRDMVEWLLQHKDKWNHNMMDDQGIGYVYWKTNIDMSNTGHLASINKVGEGKYDIIYYQKGEQGGMTITDLSDLNQLKEQYAFRVKHDPDRNFDLYLMNELFKVIER